MGFSTAAGNRLDTRAPSYENTLADTPAHTTTRQGTATRCIYCQAATPVPINDEKRFVPITRGTGKLGNRMNKAGICTNPPPPTMESINPAVKAAAHRKNKVVKSVTDTSK